MDCLVKFSFCTTCRDRFADLQLTLPNNRALIHDDEELLLLDYCGPDDLLGWAQSTFTHAVTRGRLRVYRENTAPRFFMSHAKNVAHLLARGKVLVNLDADNYLTPEYLNTLRAADWDKVWVLYPRSGSGGFKGRTAIRADIFHELGGFDETMNKGYGYEEIDLYRRLARHAVQKFGKPTHSAVTRSTVAHVNIDPASAIPTTPENKAAGQVDGWTVADSEKVHRRICEANLRANKVVANAGRDWGVATVQSSDGKTLAVRSSRSVPA